MFIHYKKNLSKILKIFSVLAIICCSILLLPQVRTSIIEIAEHILGRDLHHNKWMNILWDYTLIAFLCFTLLFLRLNIQIIERKLINFRLFFINKHYKEIIIYILLFFLVFFLELFFFRSMLFCRDNIIGDLGDSRLVSLILEHWYKVFFHNETIRDLSMFYPVKNTLGYSDSLFLLSLPYSFFRLIGYQWLNAYQITLITTHFFGGLCLAWFLRRNLKLPFWACIIGLIIGYYSNSFYIKIIHTQFITFSLIPLLFILLKNFYDCLSPGLTRKRIIYGLLSIFLFSGILLTSFYIGFFTALFFLIVLIVIVFYFYINKNFNIKHIVCFIKAYKYELSFYVVFGIITLLPFIYIYMPIYQEMGARNWDEINYYLPNWYNFLYFSSNNFIYELQYGYPIITGILLIIVCIFNIKKFFAATPSSGKDFSFYMSIGFSFAIVIITIFMLKFEIFGKNISLWYIIYKIIPGSSAIRAVFRFNQYLSLPVGIIISLYLSKQIHFDNSKYIRYIIMCSLLAITIFLNNQNSIKITSWTKSQINKYLEKVSLPPKDCEAFLLVNNTTNINFIHQLDAWSIANHFNIKTINGYSGQFPKSWLPIWNMEINKNYCDLALWINKYNLNNIYLYDYINNNWIKYSEHVLEELMYSSVL